MSVPFCFRVRLGQFEVEVSGSRDEVLQTIKDLPSLVSVVSEAFSQAQAVTDVSNAPSADVHEQAAAGSTSVVYPSIQSSGSCSDAVLRLLSTVWGRSTPRTLPELVEAMKANAVHYPATTLSGVLNWLVRKGRVKRWKTDKGYVYVLAGPLVANASAQSSMPSETGVVASRGSE